MSKKSIVATLLITLMLGLLAWFSVGSTVYKTYSNRAKAEELVLLHFRHPLLNNGLQYV